MMKIITLSTFHIFLIFALNGCSWGTEYPVEYAIKFDIDNRQVAVEIKLAQSEDIVFINFNLEQSLCHNFESNSSLKKNDNELLWTPDKKPTWLKYRCDITQKRSSKNTDTAYDAYFDADWAIFRGDDIVPPATVRTLKGAHSRAHITFTLPTEWNAVNTGWERIPTSKEQGAHLNTTRFKIDNPERRFDRPTGWMIAGKLGTRRVSIGDDEQKSKIAVSSPLGSGLNSMDVLTFLQFVWPELDKVCGRTPPNLLIVRAGDPMWRGGLSAGNSFFMHTDRPIISGNGTSTLVHELFHMCSGITGKKNADWIAEGLAEFYSIELIRRAGGMNNDRHQRTVRSLQDWSKSVTTIETKKSKGPITAAATLLFIELNEEIQSRTQQTRSLDDVVHLLMIKKDVDKFDLAEAIEQITGRPSKSLNTLFNERH